MPKNAFATEKLFERSREPAKKLACVCHGGLGKSGSDGALRGRPAFAAIKDTVLLTKYSESFTKYSEFLTNYSVFLTNYCVHLTSYSVQF